MRDEIKSERLVLRKLRESDAGLLSKLAGDKEISRMTGTIPHPYPQISAEFFLMLNAQSYKRGLSYNYAITHDGDDLMGVTGLFYRGNTSEIELGYWLGKLYWGHGYITEACRALIEEGRRTLNLSHVHAGVFSDNPASLRVLEKLGFEFTGEDEMYFSMARLEKARSINLRLDFEAQQRATPLQSNLQLVMSA